MWLISSKRNILVTSLVLSILPFVAFAQTTFAELVTGTLLPLLQLMSIVIIALTVLFILWNGVQMIMEADNAQKKADSRSMMMWGVVMLFVMVGMWGIVEIMQRTLGV